jgi:probable rRNA maturation factor
MPADSDATDGGRSPAGQVIVADPAWRRAIPRAAAIAGRAAALAGGADAIVLADDRCMRRLNRCHRGRDKPTNVLSFAPADPALAGEIILALGVLRREARAARRLPAHHLAHLVVHGTLHLAGYDHLHPGAARRMELTEARILRRLGVPNPWKRA